MYQPRAGRIAAGCDVLLDVVVVLLASWTVSYDVCVLLGLGTTSSLALWIVATAAVGAVALRWRPVPAAVAAPDDSIAPTSALQERVVPRWLSVLALAAAAVCAVAMAFSAPWGLVWTSWLLAAACGTVWATLQLRSGEADADIRPGPGRLEVCVVLGWAFGLAAFSLWVLRPNPDDLFYVNYSQWIAEHGSFPVRDTLFGDLVYPMTNWPPIASYDALVGTVGHVTSAHAATVEYLLVPPVATFLSVLAMWRLLRAWRVPSPAVVMSAGLVFLLLDGTASYATPGNLFVTRLWQGKIVLLCLLVPILLTYALRYVERPSRARAAALALGGTAAVGLSTTAIFLVPVMATAGMAPLLVRGRGRAALGGWSALAGYPLAAGVATLLLHGRSADDFGARRLYRFSASWTGHEIFLTSILALVGVLAVLLGAVLIPHASARLTTGLLAVTTGGIVLVPGVTRAAYDLGGLGPTLWRLSWACTVGALVGLLAVEGGRALSSRLALHAPPSVAGPVRSRWLAAVVAVVLAVTLVVAGHPVWSEDTANQLRTPFHWQRSHSSRSVVSRILTVTRPGDLVLAPDPVSITLAVTTTGVKSVAPRDYYLANLRRQPGFHYARRLRLVHYVNAVNAWSTPGIAADLRTLGVRVVCLLVLDHRRIQVVRRAGYAPFLRSTYYRCLQRT